jgi:hypothetical protein
MEPLQISTANLENLDTDTLRKLVAATKQVEAEIAKAGPQTDDELWDWIYENMGIEIPRAAVCEGTDVPHVAPFKFFADLYFERVQSALAMANRGGGKTMNVALLHFVNAQFKPGIECCTFGAIDVQADKCYGHLKNWIYDENGELKPEIVDSLRKETNLKNGSKILVLGSTPEQVNGPHPQKVHGDEIEQVREDTWKESRNMSMGKKLKDGRYIKAQDILTSTRKGPRGRMQMLINEIREAKSKGDDPPFELYAWCIFEDAAQVRNCREAPENADLPEWTPEMGEDAKENCKCRCDKQRQGVWDDGTERRLNQVCKGRLYRSRGYKGYDDIVNDFRQNNRFVWEAQIECAESREENLILPDFRESKHVIRHFLPNPKNGPIYMSVDWGGTAANAVSWYQLTEAPLRVVRQNSNFELEEIIIPGNSLVCFDELYHEDWPPTKLGKMVLAKEAVWREEFPDFMVQDRFPDPQGRGARNEWAILDSRLKTHWFANRDFEQQVTYLHELIEDDRFYVDSTRCPMFVAEALSWKRDENTGKEVREFNHQMSAFRYAVANIRMINARILRSAQIAGQMPVAATDREYKDSPVPVAVRQNREGPTDYERWRGRFNTAQPNVNVINLPDR